VSRAKEAAGRAAAELVRDGMVVGLGTGSTVHFTLQRLAERLRVERLALRCVPTSLDTEQKARALGLPGRARRREAIDPHPGRRGRIDARFDMIKGGGGARLLREKVVAALSKRG
jgi:ribose 5-phosphate isomerase A